MEILAWLAVSAAIVALFIMLSLLREDLASTKAELRLLQSTVEYLQNQNPNDEVAPDLVTPETLPEIKVILEERVLSPASLELPVGFPETKVKLESSQFQSWKRIEKFLLENMTGILGTIGVVLGLGFLGIYTALMLDPFYRVVLLTALSGAVATVAGFFQRGNRWRALAQWCQSAAFAIFLLCCLGSGGIDGLKWLSNPLAAWGLLTIGVIANLGLAFYRKLPIFASVHAILGLLALAVAGASPMVVGTMSTVSVGSILLVRDQRWQTHLCLTEAVFVGILVLFYFSGPMPSDLLRYVATTGLLTVFVLGQATHYRKAHSNWETSAVITHLLFWALTCVGLFLYAPQNDFLLTPSLAGASLATGIVARLARKRGIRWLYRIDTLFSLAGMFAAVLSLMKWQVALTPAILAILVVSLAFTMMMILERESLLAQIGSRVTEVLILLIAGLGISGSDGIALSIAGLLIAAFQALFVHRQGDLQGPPRLFDLLLPWLFIVASLVMPHGQIYFGIPSGYGLILAIVGLYLWQRTRIAPLLRVGLLSAIFGFGLVQWIMLFWNLVIVRPDWVLTLTVSVPLVLLPLLGVLLSRKSDLQGRVLLLVAFGANLIVSSILILAPILPVALPLVWLLIAIVFLWSPNFKNTKLSPTQVVLGYSFLLGSLSLYGPLVGSFGNLWNGFPMRWLIEGLFGLGLLITYLTSRWRLLTNRPNLDCVSPLLLEASWLVIVVTALFETGTDYRSLVAIIMAVYLLVVSFRKRAQRRILLPSLLAFWASMAFMLWTSHTRGNGWELGITAVVQIVWLATILRTKPLATVEFPSVLGDVGLLVEPVFRHLALFCILPLGAFWALCLSFTFDSTILTLLWSVEAFSIFVLALILREPLFRIISLACLGVCLIRLVFFDLVQADTLSRAIVFIGVGLLLIIMNILYTRFRSRVANEKQE